MAGLIEQRTDGQRTRLGPPAHGKGGNRRPGGAFGGPDLRSLLSTIESEVIPRLLLTHTAYNMGNRQISLNDIEQLCGCALDGDTGAALALIARVRQTGVTLDTIYIDLLAGTARLLGEMWEQDRIGFLDVTVGLCTLHQILFRLGIDEEGVDATQGHALFTPLPGETHVFGALIVAKFFARAGWRTWTELSLTEPELHGLVAETAFDVVGLSVSVDRDLERLPGVIERLRQATCAPNMQIFVGGSAIDRNPGYAERAGADGTSPDPMGAISLAERLRARAS
ncbi:MAG: cobalamin-dependent protein [Pseudomonadota bacterium]